MAEVISIKVETVGVPKVNEQLKAIKEYVDYLNTHKITINADTTGSIDKFTKQVTAYNNSLARRVKAETQLATAIENRKAAESRAQAAHERTLQAQQRTIQVQERTKQATERVTQAQAKLAIEQQRTQQATQKTIQSENKLAAEREKTAQTTQRTIQSENRLAVEQERTAQAQERTAQSANKLASQQERTAQSANQLATQQERTAQATLRAATEQNRANAAQERGVETGTALGASLAGMVTQVFSLHMVLSKVVSTFREALQTMKEVDSALVTIQKTTGFTGEQLDRVTASAYDLANAYGRTATEILNAASVYARAGFKDNLEQMTELSALLQNVGDLESEVASKFLIATNAAWKLGGSYESLMSIIDGLNAQTNQAAVDMEGLTSGITVAGSVFAAAGESVQTFAGMLGTGIALTARSGSEVGRGLRTIAMNIRQIKGELDDGEIIDDESISDAAKALHSIGISVADANGELRLTSEVLDELAGKWNELTTAEQSYISQSLAGKRQANILVSLMQNWDEAQRQMALYANGAGSALQENEIYMDSWEAKSKQLSAAWTRFVNNLIDTDLIKDALDALIKLVNLLDSDIGRMLITSGGIATAIVAAIGLVTKLSTAITALNAVVAVNPLFMAIAGTTAGIYLLVKAFNSITTEAERLTTAAEEAASAYAEIQAEVQELEQNEDNLTKLEKEKLELLREQAAIKKQQADDAAREKALYDYNSKYAGSLEASGYSGTYNAFQRQLETASWADAKVIRSRMSDIEERASREGATQRAKSLINQYGSLVSDMNSAKTADEFKKLEKQAQDTYKAIVDMAVELADFAEEMGDDVPQNLSLALSMLTAYINTIRAAEGATEDAGDTTEEVVDKLRVRLKALSDEADAADTAIGGVTDAIEQFGDGSVELYDAMRLLESTIPGSTEKLYDFETASLKIKAAQIADKQSLLDFIQASKTMDLSDQIRQLEDAAAASWNLALAVAAYVPGADATTLATQMTDPIWGRIGNLKAEIQSINAWVDTLRGRSDYRTTTSTTSTAADEELEKRKQAVALLKSELEFLKAKGASEDEIVAKQKQIQSALHDQAEYMREIEANQVDINALSTEWWKIQNEITQDTVDELQQYKDRVSLLKSELALLEAQGADTDTIEAKQREIQDALKAQMDYMESIGASQSEINALATEWWNIENNILETHQKLFDQLKKTIDEYYDAAVTDKEKELQLEEKILEVQKAQVALANAQKERTVRYFNAATGQWEWGANQKNVQAAKDALQKAQESLNDYQKEQAWKEFKDAWEYVAEQIKAGAITFGEAYAYMEAKMKEIQDTYNVDMSGVLNESIGQFRGVNMTIKEFNGQTAEQLGNAVGELQKQNDQLESQTKTMNISTENAKNAVRDFKNAFDEVAKAVRDGDMTFDEAYKSLKNTVKKISNKYGIDMTYALDMAIKQMDEIYNGLDGISRAVQEGALTPEEAFDIISKALNEVSEQYGDEITKEVNAILEQKGGFKDGLSGLAKAVQNGELSIVDAFKYLEDAAKEVSDKYGIDMTGALNSAIQAMGKSGDALDALWKNIVMNQMRMNSVSWLELEEQKKQAQARGDTATVERILQEQNALHAQNEALGETIGASYDRSGYWSLNGNRLYDPQADRASGAFSTGGGVSPATTGSSKAGGNQDLLDTKWKSSAESHLIKGLGYVNTGSATADLFNLKAGQTGNVARALLMMYGTPEEQTAYFNGGGIPASLSERLQNQPQDFYYSIPATRAGISDVFAGSTNTKGEYTGGAIVYKGGAGDSVVQVVNGKVITTGLQNMGSDIVLTPDGRAYRMDSKGNLVDKGETWSNGLGDLGTQLVLLNAMYKDQLAMADSGNYTNAQIYGSQFTYDEGGVLHGIGGIKATARDEMILPPDITERILSPVSNGFVSGRMNALRSMLGLRTEFGSVDNTKIGTQNNGDNYVMNGVSISEGKARSTTVYDLAQIARSLGSYQRS